MALDKTSLKNSIKTMLEALKTEENQATAIEKFATDLSNAMDTFVKTGAVSTVVASAIPCAVDPVSHIGATTATGTGSGSIS